MIDVLDQLSPVVLESFLHVAVSDMGSVSDTGSGLDVVSLCGFTKCVARGVYVWFH